MAQHGTAEPAGPEGLEDRRGFLSRSLNLGVTAALVASYGTFFGYSIRYLFPARPQAKQWAFLAQADSIPVGGTLDWTTPSGARVAVARLAEPLEVSSFIALSSTCPHLGCQVHWEGHNNRFFCPCHNGVFDPMGKGVEGPPKGMSLRRYPLKLQGPVLFIEVPVDSLPRAEEGLTARRGAPPAQLAGLRWRGRPPQEVRS